METHPRARARSHPPLEDLVDDDVELRHFVGSDEPLPAAVSGVSREKLCWTTPSAAFAPFESEYEPDMGNCGDTVDRWYHRAACRNELDWLQDREIPA